METKKRKPSKGKPGRKPGNKPGSKPENKPGNKPDNTPDNEPGFLTDFFSALVPEGLVAVIAGVIGIGFALFEIPIAIISALASEGIGGVISIGIHFVIHSVKFRLFNQHKLYCIF